MFELILAVTIEYIQLPLLMLIAPLAIDFIVLDEQLICKHHLEMVCYVIRAIQAIHEIYGKAAKRLK